MSNCSSGGCSCECSGGKGCGCISSSVDPDICDCHCFGAATIGKGVLKLGPETLVDVSFKGLPIGEVAKFLNAVLPLRVHAPPASPEREVSLELKRKPLVEVLKALHLKVHRSQQRKRSNVPAPDRTHGASPSGSAQAQGSHPDYPSNACVRPPGAAASLAAVTD